MRYFYSKNEHGVDLYQDGETVAFSISGLDDSRIVPDSIEVFTRFSGWLEMPNDTPVQPELEPITA